MARNTIQSVHQGWRILGILDLQNGQKHNLISPPWLESVGLFLDLQKDQKHNIIIPPWSENFGLFRSLRMARNTIYSPPWLENFRFFRSLEWLETQSTVHHYGWKFCGFFRSLEWLETQSKLSLFINTDKDMNKMSIYKYKIT